MLKSHTCGELRSDHIGQPVTLAGWMNRRRDHGGLIFLDLRDRFGVTQVTINSETAPEAHAVAAQCRNEFVMQVTGVVQARPAGFENTELATGGIEVIATQVVILNPAKNPPFYISDKADEVDETLRLKYRYLDLRRPRMAHNIALRHTIVRFIREFFYARDFLEIETPILLKSTPEGARDYVVPSRVQPGKFYALPQSPQQLKQLLMVAGMERYFQIARCFRDEDLRADRQPEFTQLDLEMSFVDQEDIRAVIEALMIGLSQAVSPKHIRQLPFPILTYDESMRRFGNDRPDLRFGLELFDVSQALAHSSFSVFQAAVAGGGQVKGVLYPGGAEMPRRELDELPALVKPFGAKGVAWIGLTGPAGEDGLYPASSLRSQITKFLSAQEVAAIVQASGAQAGDMILLVADKPGVAAASLSALRLEIGKRAGLIDPTELAFCWVIDFPLVEYDEGEQRWSAVHHPFTSAQDEDWAILESDPGRVRAKAYDVVLNGWEVGGGSIRIHNSELQRRLFALLKLSDSQIQEQFGHMIEAFQYGAPPHGGIALGIERLVALYSDSASIRDVMAFPKTATGTDLMVGSPSPVTPAQLAELSIAVVAEE